MITTRYVAPLNLASFKLKLLVISLLLSAGLAFSKAQAQNYKIEEVKAALVVQVIRNLEWPNEQDSRSIDIAIWQDEALSQAFAPINQLSVRGLPLRVYVADSLAQLGNANVVYIPEAHIADVGQLSFNLRGQGILVMTEESPSLHNIMINILQRQQENTSSTLSFQINRPNIAFEQIAIKPELVLFGGTEVDVAELYHQTEAAIQALRQQNEANFEKLAAQQQAFEQREAQYKTLQARLENLEGVLDKKQESIVSNQTKLSQLMSQIGNVEQEYAKALAQVDSKEKELQAAERTQQEYENNVAQQIQVLDALNAEVEANKKLLANQESQLNEAQTEVKYQSELIDKQRDIIYVVLFVVAVALLAAVLISHLFFKNKRTKDQLATALDTLTQAKEQLVEAEKMASLGSLVTGVAHEINTPIGISLTAISTLGADSREFKQLIESGQLKKSTAIKFADKLDELDNLIVGNLQRCHRLVESFKQVSADQIVEQSRQIKLNDYCHSIMNTMTAYLKQHHVKWTISGDNPLHSIDPGLLSQVINNLSTNAVNHAFEGIEDKHITIEVAVKDSVSLVKFKDNGVGMEPTVLQRIFDPFYTTKRNEGGTGLGLNIVYTIVTTKLNGQISVNSELGSGTEFTISIPADSGQT